MKTIQLILLMLFCQSVYSQEDSTTISTTHISTTLFIDTNVYIYPPELIISLSPQYIDWEWFTWGSSFTVFVMPERSADPAERIFGYSEEANLSFESVQIGNKICTRIEAEEDQVITLKLRKLGARSHQLLSYHFLSIPLRIKKGYYEISSTFKSFLNATYLLDIQTDNGVQVSRIETFPEGDPHPFQSNIELTEQTVMENVKINHL